VVAQHRERDEVARAQAQRRERGLGADPSEAPEMGQEGRGREAGDVIRCGDEQSLLDSQTNHLIQLVDY
jgi:hypothetical protein